MNARPDTAPTTSPSIHTISAPSTRSFHAVEPGDPIDDLRRELAALRAEVALLRQATGGALEPAPVVGEAVPPGVDHFDRGATPGDPTVDVSPIGARVTSRRRAMRAVGAAVGVGAAAVVTRPTSVAAAPAAANSQPITAGEVNVFTGTTELKLPRDDGGAGLHSHVLTVQDGVWSTPRAPFAETAPDRLNGRAGIGALVGNVAMHGGFFQTNASTPGAAGVVGFGAAPTAYGAWFAGTRAALRIGRRPLQFPPPERADAHNEGEILIDDNADLWYCAVGGQPGTWLKLAGPTTAGQFHAIAPARVYDSRRLPAVNAGIGPLAAGEARVISVANAYLADGTTVSIENVVPRGATAVAFNLTIAGTGPAGYLALAPGDATGVTASTINWTHPDTVVANGSIVKLDASRRLKIFCAESSTHAIVDIAGYFR